MTNSEIGQNLETIRTLLEIEAPEGQETDSFSEEADISNEAASNTPFENCHVPTEFPESVE